MRWFAGLVAVTVILAATGPATAADPDTRLEQIRDEIDSLNQQIKDARSEASSIGREVSAARDRLASAIDAFDAAQARVDAVQAEIDRQDQELTDLRARLTEIRTRLAGTQSRIISTRARLEEQAVEMYINATGSLGMMVLTLDDTTEVAVGLEYADEILSATEELLGDFDVLRRDEQRQRSEIEQKSAEVQVIIDGLAERKVELVSDLSQVDALRQEAADEATAAQSLADRINREIRQAEQHKAGLERDAGRLEAEIRARASTGGSNPGVLAWPVSARVTSPFGYRIHPIFGTKRLHTGIDLGAAPGTTIRAAGGGTVILAGRWGGYGNAVVIDHGGGLTTVYAHMSSVKTSDGAKVSKGTPIGAVGCTGYCTGPHLHFETREFGTPVDPMGYLGG